MTSTGLRATSPDINNFAEHLDIGGTKTPQERVLFYIEETLGRVLQAIQVRPDGRASIVLRRIKDVKTSINPITQQVVRQIVDREVTYCFPGKNKDEAWRFG